MTYFNPENGLTLRYPASWKTEQAEQDGVRYRYFLAPPTGSDRKPAVSVTLVGGPLGVPLEQYAQTYLGGTTVQSSREETREGARGKSYVFASPDGKTRQSLLLLVEDAAARVGLPSTAAPRPAAARPSGAPALLPAPAPTPAPPSAPPRPPRPGSTASTRRATPLRSSPRCR